MTTSSLATGIIVIVVAVCLAAWIIGVFHAERHPGTGRRGGTPPRKITGGVFRGDPRQQMPRRDAPAESIEDMPAHVSARDGERGRGE